MKEEELASGKPVKVAHFVDGTVDQVWNRWDGVIATVPYDGFTSDYDPGVVFFRPSVGIVSILRTYDLANGSQDVCLGAPAYCLDASNNAQVRFTVTPIGPNDSIEAVTVTTASGTVISAVKNSDFVPPTDSPNTEEYVIALPTEDAVVTVAVSQYRAIICNANVYFEGQIRLSFGFDGDTLPEGGTVRISKAGHNNNDTVQDVAVADGVLVGGVMEYYLPVMIPEFADQVTVQVLDAEENLLPIRSRSGVEYGTEGFTYSVKQYAERKKVNGSTQEVRELAQALLDYGTAAQIYFEYGEYAGLSVSELVTAITAQTLIDGGFAAVVTPTEERPEGVSAGINVYFESDNTLRVTYSGMAAGTTYTYTLDSVVKKPKAGYLQVRNIAAPNLDVPHTFTISDGTKTFSVQASAISYALTCIRNGTEARQNLGKAFYLYNQAANAFFGDN